jgi:hypothetical protein
MFEQTFKNIDDILYKDAGCGRPFLFFYILLIIHKLKLFSYNDYEKMSILRRRSARRSDKV